MNVWDEEWEVGAYNNSNGSKANANNRIRCKNHIPVVPNQTYRIVKGAGWGIITIYSYNGNNEYIGVASVSSGIFTTGSNVRYITFNTGANSGDVYTNDISINYPSTDTDYHVYTGASYPVTWQTEAGTVYGGTVDLVSGLLTVTHGSVTLDGTQTGILNNWRTSETSTGWLYPWSLTQNKIYPMNTDTQDIISDTLPFETYQKAFNKTVDSCVSAITTPNGTSDWGIAVRYPDLTLTTSAAVNAFLAQHPITVCYELATPQTYQLTPTQVSMLLGTNNVWANTGSIESAVISTEIVPGQPLVPDDGAGGHYAYTVNGHTYTQDTLHAPYHWYVVEMPPDGIVVHEFDNPGGGA